MVRSSQQRSSPDHASIHGISDSRTIQASAVTASRHPAAKQPHRPTGTRHPPALALPCNEDGAFDLTPAAILKYVVGPEHQAYVFDALQQDGLLLEFVPRHLLTRTLLQRALSSSGMALKSVPEKYRDDKDLVLTAILQEPFALAYAPDSMKGDANLVLEAASQDPAVLQLASPELCADASFMLQAVGLDPTAVTYASEDLLACPQFRAAAAQVNPLSVHYFLDTPCNPTIIPHAHDHEASAQPQDSQDTD